ncbi:MAG TPA: aspartate aminotransferase family protein [Bacteroidota bacterium]|nr:aspartate aminotransferase family protein [Bacteroidota bacterium]
MSDTILEKEQQLFFHTYKRLPLEIERGEGCYLFTRDGTRYLDFFGGIAVNALGHNHSRLCRAIEEQIHKYIHVSNYFVQEPQVKLAEKILSASGYKRIFFTNSGTEATEGAIKLARKWGSTRGKMQLFGLSNAFHGRTMGALSLMDKKKYREGYEPFIENVGHLKFNDVDELRRNVSEHTLGVFVEFVQGEGGIFIVSQEYAAALKTLRDKFGFLIIADEIQSGIGRTGKLFGFSHTGVSPDIVILAKPIGGGLPLGAILGNDRVAETFTYGVHGTTFGGNPVACAAGAVVLDEILEKGLMKHAAEIGTHLLSRLGEMKREFPTIITEVRGFGCMIGVELSMDGQPVVDEMQKRHILVNCTNVNVLRLVPPLIVTKEQCDVFCDTLRSVLEGFSK